MKSHGNLQTTTYWITNLSLNLPSFFYGTAHLHSFFLWTLKFLNTGQEWLIQTQLIRSST